MKAKYYFALLCFILIFSKSQAQTTTTTSSATNVARLSKNDWGSIMRGNQPLMTKKRSDIELRGTPFYKDVWEYGSVVLSDSLFTQDTSLRFKLNLEDNEIWVLANKNPKVLIDKRIIGLDLDIGIKTLKFRKVKIPEYQNSPFRFVKVLYEGGNLKLYKHIKKEFLEANAVDKGILISGREYDSYETVIDYYTLNERQQIRKIGLKRGDLYKANSTLVEKNKEALKTFCEEHEISSSLDEKELVQLITFLDSLK
jgi:hypothetical protein